MAFVSNVTCSLGDVMALDEMSSELSSAGALCAIGVVNAVLILVRDEAENEDEECNVRAELADIGEESGGLDSSTLYVDLLLSVFYAWFLFASF